eukprot:TRINITY_DN17330_c0_g1_i1.p1 TRINITY_DN17330_c0_g1~~TRINITY_DN17330_c0_g1_i1.p1  ORF type:complete len:357 (+),score=117.72 TRINITY_DN17330_c0_g1_i1:31-1071(+)
MTAAGVERSAEVALLEGFLSRHGGPKGDVAGKPRKRLVLAQKCFIAVRELAELTEDLNAVKIEFEKEMEDLKSLKEDTDVHVADMKKEAYEFRRDIVTGAIDTDIGKVSAEAVQGYFADRVRDKEHKLETLRLRNASMKASLTKLERELQKKEDQGESFVPIDFKQLKIENHQYQTKIDKLNLELLTLKMKAGKIVQTLNRYKKTLDAASQTNSDLKQHITQQQELHTQLGQEDARVNRNIERATSSIQKLKQQQEEYNVPQVLDYVKQKAELTELEEQVKSWQRKVEIAEMELKRQRTKARTVAGLQSTQASSRPAPFSLRGGPTMNAAGDPMGSFGSAAVRVTL